MDYNLFPEGNTAMTYFGGGENVLYGLHSWIHSQIFGEQLLCAKLHSRPENTTMNKDNSVDAPRGLLSGEGDKLSEIKEQLYNVVRV